MSEKESSSVRISESVRAYLKDFLSKDENLQKIIRKYHDVKATITDDMWEDTVWMMNLSKKN